MTTWAALRDQGPPRKETPGRAAARMRNQRTRERRQRDAEMTAAAQMIEDLRFVLQDWEPHVKCPQCGKRYRAVPCGSVHEYVRALVLP